MYRSSKAEGRNSSVNRLKVQHEETQAPILSILRSTMTDIKAEQRKHNTAKKIKISSAAKNKEGEFVETQSHERMVRASNSQ